MKSLIACVLVLREGPKNELVVWRCGLWLTSMLLVHLIPSTEVCNAKILVVLLVLLVLIGVLLFVVQILVLVEIEKTPNERIFWLLLVIGSMVTGLSGVFLQSLAVILLTINLINRWAWVGVWCERAELARCEWFPVCGDFVIVWWRSVEIFQLIADFCLCNASQHVSAGEKLKTNKIIQQACARENRIRTSMCSNRCCTD